MKLYTYTALVAVTSALDANVNPYADDNLATAAH